jgi:prepilin-type N-terminal cleavage/methylation domain-containing protein
MKKAFTLLEMLVVIGIIAILVSLGFASYSTVQKKARDAKRKGDLSAMQKVLEQCYSLNSYSYPTITGGGTTELSTDCTALGGPDITFTDPTTKTYTVTQSGGVAGAYTTYSVTVTLEDTTPFEINNQQ